jgi:hypothetical protein
LVCQANEPELRWRDSILKWTFLTFMVSSPSAHQPFHAR